MRKKRLSNEDVVQIVKQLGEGKDAKELASTYNVSVATIYNFRTRLKRTGTEVLTPGKRGRKPKDKNAATPVAPIKRGRKPKASQLEFEDKKTEATVQKVPTSVKMERYNFIINGVKVTVSGRAKYVHVASDSMIIDI